MDHPVFREVKQLIRLGFPIVVGNSGYTLLAISDIIMSGMAGTADLAGVAAGASFFFPVSMLLCGLITALHPVIGRLRGAGEYQSISKAHIHAAVACLITSLFISAVLLFIALCVINLSKDARMDTVARHYILILAFVMPVSACFQFLRAYCEAMGKSISTLYFGLLPLLYNIPLNYLFIFGAGPIPALGGTGCAVATAISMVITVCAMALYILRNKDIKDYSLFKYKGKISWSETWQFFKLGIPLGVASSVESSAFSLIALMLTPLGPVSVSGHTVAISVTSLLFNLPLAVGIAAAIQVGFCTGSKDMPRLRNVIKAAYRTVGVTICISLTLIFTLHDYIPRWYSDDAAVQAVAGTLLYFAMVNQIFEHLQSVQAFILRGFKDTVSVFKSTLVAFYIIAMPLGYALTFGYIPSPFTGPSGFWVGILCGLIFAACYYRRRVLFHYRQLKSAI